MWEVAENSCNVYSLLLACNVLRHRLFSKDYLATKNFSMSVACNSTALLLNSVRPSVCTHETSEIPKKSSWNFTLEMALFRFSIRQGSSNDHITHTNTRVPLCTFFESDPFFHWPSGFENKEGNVNISKPAYQAAKIILPTYKKITEVSYYW